MAKTEFTEIRLGAITRKLEYAMWVELQMMSNNIDKFKAGDRTARETMKTHRLYVELFLRHERNYHRAVSAANRIDGCEGEAEQHYASGDYTKSVYKFMQLCEFFEKK